MEFQVAWNFHLNPIQVICVHFGWRVSSTTSSPEPRTPRSNRSQIWSWCEDVEGSSPPKVRCKFCRKDFSTNSGATFLKEHHLKCASVAGNVIEDVFNTYDMLNFIIMSRSPLSIVEKDFLKKLSQEHQALND